MIQPIGKPPEVSSFSMVERWFLYRANAGKGARLNKAKKGDG